MRYVAFFRNVNLGQGCSPTRVQLEQGFKRAGAESPRSFLSNGTVVFDADSAAVARQQLAAASGWLQRWCGLEEPACVRPLSRVAALARSNVFAGHESPSVYEYAVSLRMRAARAGDFDAAGLAARRCAVAAGRAWRRAEPELDGRAHRRQPQCLPGTPDRRSERGQVEVALIELE